jgi:hypothetical protein
MKQKLITFLLAIVALLGGGYAINDARLSSVGGLPSTVATSTSASSPAGTTRLLFATSTSCSSRIISTQASEIRLTFSDFQGIRPTQIFGHAQGASTTEAYDAELYGCNAVYAFLYGSTTLTLTETR